MEIWKDIRGFEDYYQISSLGNVKRIKFNRVLKNNYCTAYPSINLCVKSKRVIASIHRLVAMAFVPNPDNKPNVNHIDGDKQNFNIDNLEWTTQSENCNHAYKTGLSTVSEKCKQAVSKRHSGQNHYNAKKVVCNNTGTVYNTIREAAAKNNLTPQALHTDLHKQIKRYNFQFYNN